MNNVRQFKSSCIHNVLTEAIYLVPKIDVFYVVTNECYVVADELRIKSSIRIEKKTRNGLKHISNYIIFAQCVLCKTMNLLIRSFLYENPQ